MRSAPCCSTPSPQCGAGRSPSSPDAIPTRSWRRPAGATEACRMSVADELAEIPLVDQHCHPVVLDAPDRSQFELMLSEARDPRPQGTTDFDTQVGLAVRRWCAPVL